jgi:hypothetical protein
METKQTAVEWLIEHIKLDAMYEAKSIDEWANVFEKAKEMEELQIREAYYFAKWNSTIPATKYYNKTYGK